MRLDNGGNKLGLHVDERVVGNRCRLGLQLIQCKNDVGISHFLNGDRIVGIIDQYVRVASEVDQMNGISLPHELRIVGNAVEERSLVDVVEAFDELLRPHLRNETGTQTIPQERP